MILSSTILYLLCVFVRHTIAYTAHFSIVRQQSIADTEKKLSEGLVQSEIGCSIRCFQNTQCRLGYFHPVSKLCELYSSDNLVSNPAEDGLILKNDYCPRVNVAFNKPCSQSSLYKNDVKFACDKANDGSFNDYIHTLVTLWDGTTSYGERFPFWWVDLQTPRSVKEVVIHNRQDRYFFRLHNINVTVGDDLSTLHQCGYFDGQVPNKNPLTIRCSSEVKGRYVQIMNMDTRIDENILHVTEIEVYDCWS